MRAGHAQKSFLNSLLDGINGASFLRSDVSDTAAGPITVSGSLSANSTLTVAGATTLNGSIYSGGFPTDDGSQYVCWKSGTNQLTKDGSGCNTSDRRMKTNIHPLKPGLDAIMRLKPVSYEWKKADFGHGIKFGLIAQDVMEVMPELVTGMGDAKTEDWYGLNYTGLSAPMIKAIQELKTETDSLHPEIGTLRSGLQVKGENVPDGMALSADDPTTLPWNAAWLVWVLLALNATVTTILIFRRPVAR